MRAVLRNCPSLLYLKCLEDQKLPNQLEFIADHNRNLKVLKLFTIRETNASFEFLESLTLKKIEKIDHLLNFLVANPTIKTLCIEELNERDYSDAKIETLISGRNLKHVWINGPKSVAEEIYRHLKTHGPGTWQSLELTANWEEQTSVDILKVKANFSFTFHRGLVLLDDLLDNKTEHVKTVKEIEFDD